MIAFDLATHKAVDFHAMALEQGATDDGAPGGRGPNFYMSYFQDLDGDKSFASRID